MNTVSETGGFETAAVVINNSSSYVLVDTIAVPDGLRGRPYIVKGIVGSGGAIAGLKFTEAAVPEDTHYTLAQDSDFNSATALFPFASSSAYQTAAGGVFVIRFQAAPPEFAVYAKKASANTTLQIIGSILV
jgi:hypothetical protein